MRSDLIEGQQTRKWHPALRTLLTHPDADIRRRSLAALSATRRRLDRPSASRPCCATRMWAFGPRRCCICPASPASTRCARSRSSATSRTSRSGPAPRRFWPRPGRAQNLEAARLMLEGMARSDGPEGQRDRAEAARLIGAVQEETFLDLLGRSSATRADVARQAIRAAQRLVREELRAVADSGARPAGAGGRSGRRTRPSGRHGGADDRRGAEVRGSRRRGAPRAAVGAAADRNGGGRADARR